jgi:sulfite reductase (ferredoxin)
VAHEVNDVSFVGVQHPVHGPGFDVWVGGGLSTNPKIAQRLGAFVALDEVAEVWVSVVRLFRDYGYRRLRHKARLKFLVTDWGTDRFREVLEMQYLERPLRDGPPPAPPATGRRDHVGVHRQRDGRAYVGVAPTVGRVSGSTLAALADLVEAAGSGRVRLTAQQKLVILDVDPAAVDDLVPKLQDIGLYAGASEFRRGAMACTGIEYCKLAIVETKVRGASLVEEMEARMPEFAQPLTVHVNGCPNSCARIQTADIGFKGQIVTAADGEQVEGYQVHLGGTLGENPAFGRKLRGHKVTAENMPAYVERVVSHFESSRNPEEPFAQWALRAPEEDLV